MVLSLAFLFYSWSAAWVAAESPCAPRTMRVTFYTCAEGFSHCLTKKGNQPIPFRTVAVGDRTLLGRWLYVEDLGGWVHASDTGSALGRNALDVFIGEARMVPHARRLGVQFWKVRLSCRPPAPASGVAATPPRAAPAPAAAPGPAGEPGSAQGASR